MSKTDSLTRSAVGRMAFPLGKCSFLPFALPEMIRMGENRSAIGGRLLSWEIFRRLQYLLDLLSHVGWMGALPIDPVTGRASMKYPMAVEHELWNLAFGLTPGHGLQRFVAPEAPRKKSFRVDWEPQGLYDSHNLKIGSVLLDNDDVSQKKLGLKPSISSQDDPFLRLGNLNKAVQVLPWEDSGIKAEASQPLGQFSQRRIDDESLFHARGKLALRDQRLPALRLP